MLMLYFVLGWPQHLLSSNSYTVMSMNKTVSKSMTTTIPLQPMTSRTLMLTQLNTVWDQDLSNLLFEPVW